MTKLACPCGGRPSTFTRMATATDDATAISGGRRRRGEACVREADLLRDRAALRPSQSRPQSQHRPRLAHARRSPSLVSSAIRAGAYLDLCAGTLDVSAALASTAGFAGSVIGADFAEPMLRAGRRQDRQGARIAPVDCRCARPAARRRSSAGAIVAFGIRNVAGLDAGLAEVHRVLAPRWALRDPRVLDAARRSSCTSLYQLYFHHVLPAIGRLVSGHPHGISVSARRSRTFPSATSSRDAWQPPDSSDVRWRAAHLRRRRDSRRRGAHAVSLDNISQFIAAIDAPASWSRITQPVAAKLELCEIADRVMKQPDGGRALLFEHVMLDDGTRSAYPVAINLFGSMTRMSLALGVRDLDDDRRAHHRAAGAQGSGRHRRQALACSRGCWRSRNSRRA